MPALEGRRLAPGWALGGPSEQEEKVSSEAEVWMPGKGAVVDAGMT